MASDEEGSVPTLNELEVPVWGQMQAVIECGEWKLGLTLNADDMSSLSAPVLMVCGTSDPGFEGFDWERFIAHTPDGALDLLDAAGHEPWFEEPEYVANSLGAHFELAVD